MIRKFRIIAASLFFIGTTLLFLDFTGSIHAWLGWMAKIQFIPAVLALNVIVVAILAVCTLLFGRVYCSVICPLGIMQDIISWWRGKRKKKDKYRFSYHKAHTWVRISVLAVFIAAIAAGLASIAGLIAPYSAYGRIASSLFAPVYQLINNGLAYISEAVDSYAFYPKDVWLKSLPVTIVAIVTFVTLFVTAWKGGRIWCNSVCPVGTILGFISRWSLFAPVIDESKCRACGLCGRRCKSSCIDMKAHKIDYSRCVVCMDCIDTCREGAIKYTRRWKKSKEAAAVQQEKSENGRRKFIASAIAITGTAVLKAQDMKVDGGLAKLSPKQKPQRATHISPPGSWSLNNIASHCTACQLCISACPNDVLVPSMGLDRFMQPEMDYTKGYCRPECTKCSEVCPAGAIRPITREEKSSIQIGHAVLDYKLCIADSSDINCGNCARHCPAGAITMVKKDPDNPDSVKIPSVIETRCIGCGACENLCPVRPISAIHVEGHLTHKVI